MTRIRALASSALVVLLTSACSKQSEPATPPRVDAKPARAPETPAASTAPAAADVVEAKPPSTGVVNSPATLADALRVIDLRQLPRLPDAHVRMAKADQVSYTAPGSVRDGAALYRTKLSELGWTEDKTPVAGLDASQYAFLELDKAGFRVSVSISKNMKDGLVDVHLSNHGNVDSRRLPRLADAMPTLTRWHYVSYKTATKPEAVIDFYRKEFKPQGWQEYRMALAKVHAKEGRHLLGFAQNAMNLSFNIKAEKDGPTVVECMVNMRDRPARTPLKDLPPPATLAEGHKVIDLNRFPRLEGAGAGQGSSAQLFYDAPGDVAGALAFYRKHCAAQGWQEDDPETEIDAFPRRAFVKSGFVLDCAFGKSNKAGRVNLRIENKGNVDLRQLPRLADATDMNNERFDDVHYETDTPPPAAADFFRQELVAHGWKEAASEAKSYPDGSKLLVFRHNALTLKIQLHADSVRLQSSLFGVFIPRPAAEAEALRAIDLRKFPSYKGAAGVKATSASLELTALGSVAEAVRFYRQELTKQGWQERGPAFQTAERATLRFGKDDFLLHLAVRIEGQGVAIALYNKGDVDVRKLLHPDDAKPDATSVEDDARYSTALPIEAAADFYRKQLPHFGWQEATAAEAPTEKAPARSLAFIQKSMKLVIDVTPVAEGKAALHLQTWVLGKR